MKSGNRKLIHFADFEMPEVHGLNVVKWVFYRYPGSDHGMKFGVVVFPGSNCDHDAFYAIGTILKKPVEFIWHQSQDLANCDVIILPGGFAYGDYLRTGAIARFSPVMKSVSKFAKSGGMVLGVCNGFQILLEAGLLPGAMMRNSGLRFICRHVYIRVEQTDTPFTNAATKGQILKIPIAHSDGNYNADEATACVSSKKSADPFPLYHPGRRK